MSELFTFLTGRAVTVLGGRADRVIPSTIGSSLAAAALLAGWLVAMALLLTSVVWAFSGEVGWALAPLIGGSAMGVALARVGGRFLRRRATSGR